MDNHPSRPGECSRSPDENGDSTFNLEFDFIFRSITDRLRRYDTADACGKWNATLVNDFRSDAKFIRTADELFSGVVAQQTHGECIASDGLAFETLFIELGVAIDLHFRLNFLDGPNGYRIAPGKLSVATDATRADCTRVTLCCGLSGHDGNFWYPSTNRIANVVLPEDYAWAYSYTRLYGPPTISSWFDRRPQGSGEQ